MRLSINNIRGREEYLRKIIEEKEKALSSAPDGALKISYSHGKVQYKQIQAGGNKKECHIPSGDMILVRQLAQKKYDEKILKKAKREICTISRLISQYESGTCDDLYNGLSDVRKKLIVPVMVPDDEFIKMWLDDPYEGLGFEEGSKEYYSSAGLRVRSKSESSIADKYDEYSIPMKYEKPLILKGYGVVYPDYTLLNVRLRKIYIHEHMGMMDDPEYAENNTKKLLSYQRNGYFPGKNLILTFETKGQPFDARLMDDIIKQYLL